MRPFSALIILATITGTLAGGDPPRLDREGDPLPTGAVARFGHNRLRHPGISGEDDGFAFNPAGKTIASWDENTVRLWDLADGRQLWHLGTDDNIFTVIFAPDGKRLAVCTAKEVVIVDAATGKPERTLNASARSAAAFSPDRHTLATARNDWGQWIGHRPGGELGPEDPRAATGLRPARPDEFVPHEPGRPAARHPDGCRQSRHPLGCVHRQVGRHH
jgi:hypothetical protein